MMLQAIKKYKEILTELDVDYAREYDYADKFLREKEKSGLNEAVKVGRGEIGQTEVVIIELKWLFMAGTVGIAAGEKIACAFEYATKYKKPVIALSESGGIRIQEGVTALVAMAKINAALMKFRVKRLPFISVLMDPVYGGVVASFALMGDINIGLEGARIGFGGKKLVTDILHEKVSSDFQTAEYLYRYGGLDIVCDKRDLEDTLTELLAWLNFKGEFKKLDKAVRGRSYIEPKDILRKQRKPHQLTGRDYVAQLFDDYVVLAGDRISFEDSSICAGIGILNGRTVAFIAQCKGRNMKEDTGNNYGMTRPEGYRKSLRIARLADKFSLPLLVLLDSPGAHPGNVAEENNQSIAIAENLMQFLDIKTPIVSIVIGEACSGGALALSVADRLAMFDDSMYAVISPESYAKILKRKEVNDLILTQMKYTAYDLKKKNIIDAVLKSKDFDYNSKQVKKYFCESIRELEEVPIKDLLDMRYNKVRYWGWTIK